MDTHLRVLSESYLMNTNMTEYRFHCTVLPETAEFTADSILLHSAARDSQVYS